MLNELKPIYPNEERLWQLFLRVHDSAPAVPSLSAVHSRVQIAYTILQEYEKEVALLRAREQSIAEINGLLVDDLDLPCRVLNCLRAENLTTVDQLCMYSENKILRIPNMGRKGLNYIKDELLRHGRELAKV